MMDGTSEMAGYAVANPPYRAESMLQEKRFDMLRLSGIKFDSAKIASPRPRIP